MCRKEVHTPQQKSFGFGEGSRPTGLDVSAPVKSKFKSRKEPNFQRSVFGFSFFAPELSLVPARKRRKPVAEQGI